jgi:hypothetical protein
MPSGMRRRILVTPVNSVMRSSDIARSAKIGAKLSENPLAADRPK